MNSDADKAKGKVKQVAGDLTDNQDLIKEGKTDEKAGKAKGFVENAKDKLDDAVDTVKDKVNKKK